MVADRLKIIMELRPANDGFSGIPQETRVLFSELSKLQDHDVVGLLNSNQSWLKNTKQRSKNKKQLSGDQIYSQAATVLSLSGSSGPRFGRIGRIAAQISQVAKLETMRWLGQQLQFYDFDMSAFPDFLWQAYFAKSISAADFDRLATAQFAVMGPSWSALQRMGKLPFLGARGYQRMDTSKYDVLVAQTPWPGRISAATQLVIRYHDAIPIFFPHTIHNPRWHQFSHYFPLRSNIKQGALLICNSSNSQEEALRMFPEAAGQTRVIPCIVSDDYYPENSNSSTLSNIVGQSIERDTEPTFTSSSDRAEFYERHLAPERFRYIMMVSTIEPRKNHSRLIAAWKAIRMAGDLGLKLVIVGRPGWHYSDVLAAMRPFQERGALFNVSQLSPGDLRRLYGGAEAVICPSIAEGFDLSGIEAMLSGAAVAASDIPVHREVYKDAAEYFSPYSTGQATDAIRRIIEPAHAGESGAPHFGGRQDCKGLQDRRGRPNVGAAF
jgi:glycosyltransferase involved in cell wall biosynthesis